MLSYKEFHDAIIYGDFEEDAETFIKTYSHFINHAEDGYTVLHNMMSEEQWELIPLLEKYGADVNAEALEGIAPLHLACYRENAEALIEAGADINLGAPGSTPLQVHAAEGAESHEVIKYLLWKGADVTFKDSQGQTALDIAKRREDWNNVRILKRAMTLQLGRAKSNEI